jgi:diazepam-binding inhibitor (GABA receptor modulator, acyl-CoA-binding protein)
MSLDDDFEAAVGRSRSLPSQGNENLLKLYALFKQARNGDVSGKRPGMMQLRERAKYDAWASLKGKSQEDAKREYVELVDRLAQG